MSLKHTYTVEYGFDTDNITAADRRDVITRHYDFIKWCETNAKAPYFVDPVFSPLGITVSFAIEKDLSEFVRYIATYYWIFLHN